MIFKHKIYNIVDNIYQISGIMIQTSSIQFNSIQSFIFLQQNNAIVSSIQNIEKKVNKGLLKYCAYMCPIQLLQGLKWQ